MRTTSMTSRSILVCSGQPREEYPPSAADACRWNQGPATPVLKCRAPMISHNKRPFDGTRERKKKVNAYESKGSQIRSDCKETRQHSASSATQDSVSQRCLYDRLQQHKRCNIGPELRLHVHVLFLRFFFYYLFWSYLMYNESSDV